MMKRLAIYSYSGTQGIVAPYAHHFLKNLLPWCHDIIFVTPRTLIPEEQTSLGRVGIQIVERCTPGTSVNSFIKGWENVRDPEKYDELILCDDQVYGPVFEMDQLFKKMEDSFLNCDLWTVFSQTPKSYARELDTPERTRPDDSAFSFIAFKKSVFTGSAFKEFFSRKDQIWSSIPEQVAGFEVPLLDRLEKENFKLTSFVQSRRCADFWYSGTLLPAEALNEGAPLVKKEVFTCSAEAALDHGRGGQARQTLKFLMEKTSYPTELIWQDLLAERPLSELRDHLCISWIFEGDARPRKNISEILKSRIMLILYVESSEDLRAVYDLIEGFKPLADIYVISPDQKTLEEARNIIHTKFSKLLEFCHKELRKGGVTAALELDLGKNVKNYDFVCVLQAPGSLNADEWGTRNEIFRNAADNLAVSAAFIGNVISTFIDNPRLGVLTPPPLKWGPVYSSEYDEQENALPEMKKLFKEFKLQVPEDPVPVQIPGNMLWFRTCAVAPLFEKGWSYSDIPEPQGSQRRKTPPEVQVRLAALPYIAQSQGFYSGTVMSSEGAAIYMANLSRVEKACNETIFQVLPKKGYARTINSFRHLAGSLERGRREKVQKYTVLNMLTLGKVPSINKKFKYLNED